MYIYFQTKHRLTRRCFFFRMDHRMDFDDDKRKSGRTKAKHAGNPRFNRG